MFIIITLCLNSVTFELKGYNYYGKDSNRINFEFERICQERIVFEPLILFIIFFFLKWTFGGGDRRSC